MLSAEFFLPSMLSDKVPFYDDFAEIKRQYIRNSMTYSQWTYFLSF